MPPWVAGAAAAAGLPLAGVAAEARAAAESVGSMGVATSACMLPGGQPSDRIKAGDMELGLGIHGEPGAETAKLQPVHAVVAQILDRVSGRSLPHGQNLPHLGLKAGDPVALLVNGLGATTQMELYVAARAAVHHARHTLKVDVQRLYVGNFMTALNMAGLSLSLLRLDATRQQRLDAPTQAPGWPSHSAAVRSDKKPAPLLQSPAGGGSGSGSGSAGNASSTVGRPAKLSPQAALLERCVTAAAAAVTDAAAELDEMDSRVGDGDCGSTLKLAAQAIQEDLEASYPLGDAAATLAAVGESVGRAAGGTSGGLYHVLFAGAAASLARSDDGDNDLAAWAGAARAGVDAIQKYGGASSGSRTMLDALLPAVDNLEKATGGAAGAAAAAAAAARQGAESTTRMDAGAGRSSYVPAAMLRSTPDPGAVAAATWIEAVAKALAG